MGGGAPAPPRPSSSPGSALPNPVCPGTEGLGPASLGNVSCSCHSRGAADGQEGKFPWKSGAGAVQPGPRACSENRSPLCGGVGGQDTPQRRPRPLRATAAVFSASLLGLGPSYPQLKAPLETPLVRDTFPCEGRGLADWAGAPAEVFRAPCAGGWESMDAVLWIGDWAELTSARRAISTCGPQGGPRPASPSLGNGAPGVPGLRLWSSSLRRKHFFSKLSHSEKEVWSLCLTAEGGQAACGSGSSYQVGQQDPHPACSSR